MASDEADADPLPPRSSTPRGLARSTAPRGRDAPSADALLAKKYVELDLHRAHVAAGKFNGLTAEQTRARFGSTTLPIFVPLARGESIRQYEQRFEEWLRRDRALTLRELEGNEKLRPLERRLRITFAELNVKGAEKFRAAESPRSDGEHNELKQFKYAR